MTWKITMGQKELVRGKVMELVKERHISLKEAAVRIKVSYRQAKQIFRRYQEGGDAALIHRNRGKISSRRTDGKTKERALAAYRERYADFGPTFAAEKLSACEGITISPETLRQWLLAAGLEGRRGTCCLMNMVDDATGITLKTGLR